MIQKLLHNTKLQNHKPALSKLVALCGEAVGRGRESIPGCLKCVPTNRENKQHWLFFICSKVHAAWQHILFMKEKALLGCTSQIADWGWGTLVGSKISGPQEASYSSLLNVESAARNLDLLRPWERKVGIVFCCAWLGPSKESGTCVIACVVLSFLWW